MACQLWEKERDIWDQNGVTRVALVKKEISEGGSFGCFCFVVLIGVAWYVGAQGGASAGWGVFLLGSIPFGMLMALIEKIQTWRRRKELEPVPFWKPKPVYIQPPPNQEPPPRRESPPPQEPKPPAPPPGKITTLRQAIETLGLPPKTTKSECQKAYRTLIAQYHPDKVAHLASEFRKMAAEKSLQLNLAMQFIESYLS